MAITAKIIADSLNPKGCRLTTFVLTFPRFELCEFNTHRVFSRNSSSSRAVPFAKMLKQINENPCIPIKWMRDHPGMQGSLYFTDERDIESLESIWLEARDAAVYYATKLNNYVGVNDKEDLKGVTKQLCNRLLEPFMWQTCLLSVTDIENYFALRAHSQAEIHFQDLSYKMLTAYNESTPTFLHPGEWHIPFGDTFDHDRLKELMPYIQPASVNWYHETWTRNKIKVATARCARVSYYNFEGKDDYDADIKLHDQLSNSAHWSPFEHCAQAQDDDQYYGNFQGFKQYRKFFSDENKSDSRVITKHVI